MENNPTLSYDDCQAAKAYAKDVESTHVSAEWYLVEQAFKDGICHAKGIKYDFMSDYGKETLRLMVNIVKEQEKIIENYGK